MFNCFLPFLCCSGELLTLCRKKNLMLQFVSGFVFLDCKCTGLILRQQTASFNKNRCLFCQDSSEEVLHNVVQDSRDVKLKEAFREYPASLSLYKIRTEHAFDAMAGDIKYHQSCWHTIIHKRVPEVKIPKKSVPPVCDITPSPPLPSPLPPPPPKPDVEFSMEEATL